MLSCVFVDRIRVDDPVGAVSVHGVCGAWGTLAVGLFGADVGLFSGGGAGQLGIQALGVAAAFLWAFPLCFAMFYAIKITVGLRASEEDEIEGLDLTEHGIYAYPPAFVNGVQAAGGSSLGTTPATHSPAIASVENA